MEVERWMITIACIILTWAGSLIAFRVGTSKDIGMLRDKEVEQRKKNAKLLNELNECVTKTDCGERRSEIKDTLKDIKDNGIRLEGKFDDYITNGR
ncbi:MAG: hypothetical protein NWE89_11570 [Candidatus Bathyarchaeota archaeon]|nr:hypothetical protein [Candidatus Bathyarchaeota archaeon]